MARNPVSSTAFSGRGYIQKTYQSKLILKFCLLAVLGTALFCVTFYFSMNKEIDIGYGQALGNLRLAKSNIVHAFLLSEGGAIIVLGVAVVILMLLMSHRIAGPLWRIEQTAKAVGSGDLSQKIHLRDKDEMRPLADKMNDMIGELKSFVEDLGTQYELLDKDIAHLKEQSAQGGVKAGELQEIAGGILEKSKALLCRLEEIKTK